MNVPVEHLRREVEASGLSAADLAQRLGWTDHHGYADSHRVRRVLGLLPQDYGHGHGVRTRRTVRANTADKIRAALAVGS